MWRKEVGKWPESKWTARNALQMSGYKSVYIPIRLFQTGVVIAIMGGSYLHFIEMHCLDSLNNCQTAELNFFT